MRRLICFFFGHKESITMVIRKWTISKQRYVRKEYQHSCERCGCKSKWMRWKHYPDLPKGWK